MTAGCSALGSFLAGYDAGIIASILSPEMTNFHSYFFWPDDSQIGAIVSIFSAGAVIGSLVAGYLADRWGRILTLRVSLIG